MSMATKKEPDGEHPPSHYLVVEDSQKPSTWHLRVRDADGSANHNLMGAAWAALHGGYRGNKYEGPGKEAAIAKLKSLYKSEGMELPDQQTAEILLPRLRDQNDSPRFWMSLAEPPATGLIRIPIAITGKWNGTEKEFSVGLDDLNEIRQNFAEKPTGEINVDYEHASEVPFGTGGPVISAGRIVKLDKPESFNGTGKHILWGWFEPTARARELIANKEYRYISPAIRWGAKDKVSGKMIGTVLTSVALVNKPFLEELPQLHLSEVAGDQKILVSLGQLHVPGPVNQISAAYGQPGQKSVRQPTDRSQKSGGHQMAKSLRLKCLTDEHLEKHGLEPEDKGKIGVFDGEELIGVAPPPEGWGPKDGEGDGNGKESEKLAELFATEIGLPGKSFVDIAAMVKRGREAPQDQFAALSESIHDGRINLLEAGKLADAGRVKFSTILQAQEAARKVEAAVKAGKVLPKNRAHALRMALSDVAAFAALVEQGQPVVDLRTRGHAGGGEQPTAQQALMAEVNAYAKENKCSVSVALSEVTKRQPELWQQYSEEIVTAVEAAEEEE
jgi:phage I-like protein